MVSYYNQTRGWANWHYGLYGGRQCAVCHAEGPYRISISCSYCGGAVHSTCATLHSKQSFTRRGLVLDEGVLCFDCDAGDV